MFANLRSALPLITALILSACSSENNNDIESSAIPAVATDVPPAENPEPPASNDAPAVGDETPPVTNTGLPQLFFDSALPATLDQSFNCDVSAQTPFKLQFSSNGEVQYSDNDGGVDSGTYELSGSSLSMSFSSGIGAQSTSHALAGQLVVGLTFMDSESVDHACIASSHNVGDKLVNNVAFTCGTRNLTGASENTFKLYADGSANWENVFEIIDDTLFETRIGTYLFDAVTGSALMVFKQLNANELLVFTVAASPEQVLVTSGPTEGDGSEVTQQECRYTEV